MSISPSLNPHVSVDCVIFGFSKETLRLLLIKRTVPNALTELDDSYYALPGDLVRDNENLDEAAARVLKELTGLTGIFLQQFQAFGDPLRITKAKDLASGCETGSGCACNYGGLHGFDRKQQGGNSARFF
jgi:8-oxo-dGTP diphosphatase